MNSGRPAFTEDGAMLPIGAITEADLYVDLTATTKEPDTSLLKEVVRRLEDDEDLTKTVRALSTDPELFMGMLRDNGGNIFRWWDLHEFQYRIEKGYMIPDQVEIFCIMAELLDPLTSSRIFSANTLVPLAQEIAEQLPFEGDDEAVKEVINSFFKARLGFGGCSTAQLQGLIRVVGGYLQDKFLVAQNAA